VAVIGVAAVPPPSPAAIDALAIDAPVPSAPAAATPTRRAAEAVRLDVTQEARELLVVECPDHLVLGGSLEEPLELVATPSHADCSAFTAVNGDDIEHQLGDAIGVVQDGCDLAT
jgi:hypothetical protein